MPLHTSEELAWAFRTRPRGAHTWTASIPPRIADVAITLPPDLADLCDQARASISHLGLIGHPILSAITPFLLRTEAIASSRIEEEHTTVDQLARAHAGLKASASARTVEAAVDALATLAQAAPGTPLRADHVLAAHRALMRDDPIDAHHAGRWRAVPNWIGGADRHPLGADHVPPEPGRVPALMEDLFTFLARRDLDPVAAGAIAHAQMENIHPFTDGNGRIGRALLTAYWSSRGLTHGASVPVAAALSARRREYFAAVATYRDGEAAPIVQLVAQCAITACQAGEESAYHLAALPALWRSRVRARAGSATALLLDRLLSHPVIDSEDARIITGASSASAYRAINQLVDAGVLRPLTASRRNQAWAAGEVLDESEALLDRVTTLS